MEFHRGSLNPGQTFILGARDQLGHLIARRVEQSPDFDHP
jgi:hypothetical protein